MAALSSDPVLVPVLVIPVDVIVVTVFIEVSGVCEGLRLESVPHVPAGLRLGPAKATTPSPSKTPATTPRTDLPDLMEVHCRTLHS
jgi:hypothetical protein